MDDDLHTGVDPRDLCRGSQVLPTRDGLVPVTILARARGKIDGVEIVGPGDGGRRLGSVVESHLGGCLAVFDAGDGTEFANKPRKVEEEVAGERDEVFDPEEVVHLLVMVMGVSLRTKPRKWKKKSLWVREVMLGLEQDPESGRRSRLQWGSGVQTRKRGPLVDSDGLSFRTKPRKVEEEVLAVEK